MTARGGHPARPTLEIVAARAGVSRATASRVLRGASNVSGDARDAVLRAADEISYSPNRAARTLVTRRTDSVAFLVTETEDRVFGDPFFLGMLRGAQAEVGAAGLQLVFAVASNPAEVAQFEHYAGGGHVDGVLLLSLHGDDRLPQRLEAMGVPTVLSGRPLIDDDAIRYVDADNAGGARAATELLIARGARRIATISGPLDMGAGQDRLTGYRAALRAAGRRVDRTLVVEGDFTADGGEAAMRTLLTARPDIDGVFAASDLTALGAIRAIEASGRSVPADIAVVGFDDIPEASVAKPSLTTVRQPLHDLGRAMARTMLDRIEGIAADGHTILPITVVRRDSA